MNKHLVLSLTLAVLAAPAYAQDQVTKACDPKASDCVPKGYHEDTRKIYPFVALETEIITKRLEKLNEGSNYIRNIREITNRGLLKANTKTQPWGGSYWPLNQGQIANTYQDKDYETYIFTASKHLSWEKNHRLFEKRREKVYPKIYSLDEKELAELAPSEKYDLLLGDTSFDLTNRVWAHAYKWGSEKKWGYLSSINLPAGYHIPKANTLMALWEGICHGWAVAAGHSPRPEKTVWVTLPNNKRMPFYPNDIKALVSLMWANSIIQNVVLFEGERCLINNPKKDEHGRYIDVKLGKNDTELLPRCADVHPAIYHTSIVNIVGVEGRSIVVDKNSEAAVSNQPVSGYEYKYFNPATGKEGTLEASMLSVEKYSSDPFKDARNAQTRYIVGVDMTLKYVDWERPKAKDTNFPYDDKISDFNFNYDLEIDEDGNIVGGQWRVKKNGKSKLIGNSTNQPDFFWIVPRNWKKYFKGMSGLPEWDFFQSTLPPKEYTSAAKGAHAYIHQEKNMKCEVYPNKGVPGEMVKVDCDFKVPSPQPLINVVDKLLEMSRQ